MWLHFDDSINITFDIKNFPITILNFSMVKLLRYCSY